MAAPPQSTADAPRPLKGHPSGPLKGRVRVPGDKSLSHRALIFGALSIGETRATGLLEGEDVLNTAAAMRQFGAEVSVEGTGPDRLWRVQGVGVGGLKEPEDVLDFGNAGTGSRLCLGLAATTPITTLFTGDASLRSRPMGRVLKPLREIGAQTAGRSGDRLPLALIGAREPRPITYEMPVASAQVKSALLLAGLNTPGRTTVIEQAPTRDHTERLLQAFGASLTTEPVGNGTATAISVEGFPNLKPQQLTIPADPSSAAFPVVAGLLCPGSDVTVTDVLLNPTRIGLYETLLEMGADLTYENEREAGGEPMADIRVRHSALKAVDVPPERAPRMIDEYPVLFVAAAFAEGTSKFMGLEELRVKESDRLATMAAGLKAAGASLVEHEAGLEITGTGGLRQEAVIATHLDHRIAMSFLVGALASEKPLVIDDARVVATSFPAFEGLMTGLGARFEEVTLP